MNEGAATTPVAPLPPLAISWKIPGAIAARVETERARTGMARLPLLAALVVEALDARESRRAGR